MAIAVVLGTFNKGKYGCKLSRSPYIHSLTNTFIWKSQLID